MNDDHRRRRQRYARRGEWLLSPPFDLICIINYVYSIEFKTCLRIVPATLLSTCLLVLGKAGTLRHFRRFPPEDSAAEKAGKSIHVRLFVRTRRIFFHRHSHSYTESCRFLLVRMFKGTEQKCNKRPTLWNTKAKRGGNGTRARTVHNNRMMTPPKTGRRLKFWVVGVQNSTRKTVFTCRTSPFTSLASKFLW